MSQAANTSSFHCDILGQLDHVSVSRNDTFQELRSRVVEKLKLPDPDNLQFAKKGADPEDWSEEDDRWETVVGEGAVSYTHLTLPTKA